ncbi:MAG: tRNA (guanosine(46)-N7)-methyltransferase TrmB [Oscillospiraceae bacterium]|nr:tRNA (guanosine(46)-N7)-methyltransferase TrmB [Oscillospiraceae bacterium]
MRKKKHGEERIAACSDIMCVTPEENRGKWRQYLENKCGRPLPRGIELEIGCGKGAFIAATAAKNNNTGYVALELVRDVLILAMEKVMAEGTDNIVFSNCNAEFCEKFFAPGEISRIYLNFSDPWPKKKHAKRRLTAPAFLTAYRNMLSTGGEIRMKTDNAALFEFSLETLPQNGFDILFSTNDLHNSALAPDNIMTEYEKNFSEAGNKINMLIAKRSG